MKKTIRISVKIKNCDIIFKEGLEPGEIGFEDLIFDLDKKDYERPLFIMTLRDKAEVLQSKLIELRSREIGEDK